MSYSELSFANGEMNKAFAAFFRSMLEKNIVDGVFVLSHYQKGVMPVLLSDPDELEKIDAFAPIMPVNASRLLASLTGVPSGRPVAAVVKSCEMRALIELAKLKQANLEDLLLIGIDCYGRYENADYLKLTANGMTSEQFLENAASGKTKIDEIDLPTACKICEYPIADNVDIRFCRLGDFKNKIFVEWVTEKGEVARQQMEIETVEAPTGREQAMEKLIAERTSNRDEVFANVKEKVNSFQELDKYLAMCVNCYNCRVVCPVCYCKECVFVTDTFRHNGNQYMAWADKRGALRMPADSLFYHLVRMVHISTLCVGCGQCTSACPNDIQLAELFRFTAHNTQAKFAYHPGKSLAESLPLATFQDDEFVEITCDQH